jgi:hypothetical protein
MAKPKPKPKPKPKEAAVSGRRGSGAPWPAGAS